MAQAFVTTYRNHYRWHREPKRKSKKPVDRHAEAPPPGDYWIDTSSLKQKEVLNIPYGKALVRQSNGRLMFSTYQINYCTDKVKAKKQKLREAVKLAAGDTDTESVEQTFENELLKYCEDLYSTKTSKILPPSETARRVYGYIRPEDMYTPLTNYQMIYGKAGYDIMSNPSKFFKKRTDQNEIKAICETFANNPKSVFKKLEDIKIQSIQREKQEREEKLNKIMENLDRCSNYPHRSETEICCCDF
ncbi:hypothetical protein WA026_009652 [Henosepilachna vigintioctopunctata]|uniref:Uncharacterized protein n=1 Tax=Henosepilachna vigintioctopunctata TaxID=420089 RepID=A0AAW1U4I4_9CUCU